MFLLVILTINRLYAFSPPGALVDRNHSTESTQNLALNQEWIELDLFHHGLAQFSDAEFDAAGIDAQDRFLIQFMAEQEVGHAKLISNILGRTFIHTCPRYPYLVKPLSHCRKALQLHIPFHVCPRVR
jgi:hypothetical protein